MREGEGPPPQGLPPELFVELLCMLAPRWDPAWRGEPLGVGHEVWGVECD